MLEECQQLVDVAGSSALENSISILPWGADWFGVRRANLVPWQSLTSRDTRPVPGGFLTAALDAIRLAAIYFAEEG